MHDSVDVVRVANEMKPCGVKNLSSTDISYSVGVCARYQANPKESHMIALKRIIKYVKTTTDFGVWYSKDTNDILTGYSDANWAGNADDRKSTSGGFFLCG